MQMRLPAAAGGRRRRAGRASAVFPARTAEGRARAAFSTPAPSPPHSSREIARHSLSPTQTSRYDDVPKRSRTHTSARGENSELVAGRRTASLVLQRRCCARCSCWRWRWRRRPPRRRAGTLPPCARTSPLAAPRVPPVSASDIIRHSHRN